MDALALIAVDAQQRKIAHGLEKHRDGTQILAERPVVLEREGQCNARDVIERVSGEEQPEHDLLQVRGFHQKKARHRLPSVLCVLVGGFFDSCRHDRRLGI